jgi:hypothetical protein
MPDYPEHDKLRIVADRSQEIGTFLDWLMDDQGYELAVRHAHVQDCRDSDGSSLCAAQDGELLPANIPIRVLLARYFDINEERLEDEKRAMLDELRDGVVG